MNDIKIVRTTCYSPPGCHGGCGVLLHVKDGKLVKVEGDSDRPHNMGRTCARVHALTQMVYHPDRLKYPLKRVGERGEGKWERISWTEAYEYVVNKLNGIKEQYGPEAIFFGYGTGYDVIAYISRLAYSFGSPNWGNTDQCGLACFIPRVSAGSITYGGYAEPDVAQYFPDRYKNPKWKTPSSLVVWGVDPVVTSEASFYGYWIVDCFEMGSQLIVIDPRAIWLASRAKIWLQIRPGTDCALGLGWLNVIMNEGLYDRSFVEEWTDAPFLIRMDTRRTLREGDIVDGRSPENYVCWDENTNSPKRYDPTKVQYESNDVKPSLEGEYFITMKEGNRVECKTAWQLLKERANKYEPEKVEEITWTPKEKIIDSARMYAKNKPSSIHWGIGLDMSIVGVQTGQVITILEALTGNVDVAGGNVVHPLEAFRWAVPMLGIGIWEPGPKLLSSYQRKKRMGLKEYPMLNYGFLYAHPNIIFEKAMVSGEPYPIKGLWLHASNALACMSPNPKRLYKSLKMLDFLGVVDVFMTPTAQLADIVLPAASFAERDSLWSMLKGISPVVKAIEPIGECKSDDEIMLELGRRLNPSAWPWKNVEEMLDSMTKPTGMTFRELKEKGYAYPSFDYEKHQKGLNRPDGKLGFNTPTGKYEIYPTLFEDWGYDPIPYYHEPPESPISTPTLYQEYPLILSTGARSFAFFHSQGRNIPWLREIHPNPIVEIHPQTAQELGVKSGEWVWIETKRGRCRQTVKLNKGIHPKVVMANHGWWFPEKAGAEPSLFGVWESNINLAVPAFTYDTVTGFGAPHKCSLCRIYKTE